MHRLRNTMLIVRHEYLQRVRTKSFILTTLLMPAFIALIAGVPALLTRTGPHIHPQRLVVVCPDPELSKIVTTQIRSLAGGSYVAETDHDVTPQERLRLEADLDRGRIGGFLWIDQDAINDGKVTYVRGGSGDIFGQMLLRGALSTAFMLDRLRRRGLSDNEANLMMRQVALEPITIAKGRTRHDTLLGRLAVVFLFVFILFITLLVYGAMVMRSVLEEKGSRVLEVLLCSATAGELMRGKILGVGAVGLTQVAIWIAVGFALAGGRATAAIGGAGAEISLAFYFALFYLLGYLLYSALFAAVGASFNSTDEAQQWNFVIIAPLILASTLMTPVATAPNSTLAVVSSMVPFCAPVLMFLRIVVQPPPLWQVALCVAMLLATIWIAMVVSARIYRVGVLMYGKRPTAREILKWLRYA